MIIRQSLVLCRHGSRGASMGHCIPTPAATTIAVLSGHYGYSHDGATRTYEPPHSGMLYIDELAHVVPYYLQGKTERSTVVRFCIREMGWNKVNSDDLNMYVYAHTCVGTI
jgi:hypothetical protein